MPLTFISNFAVNPVIHLADAIRGLMRGDVDTWDIANSVAPVAERTNLPPLG